MGRCTLCHFKLGDELLPSTSTTWPSFPMDNPVIWPESPCIGLGAFDRLVAGEHKPSCWPFGGILRLCLSFGSWSLPGCCNVAIVVAMAMEGRGGGGEGEEVAEGGEEGESSWRKEVKSRKASISSGPSSGAVPFGFCVGSLGFLGDSSTSISSSSDSSPTGEAALIPPIVSFPPIPLVSRITIWRSSFSGL